MEKFINKRTYIKGQMTRIYKFVNDNENIDKRHELQVRQKELTELYQKYCVIQEDIEMTNPDHQAQHEEDRISIENNYFKHLALINQYIESAPVTKPNTSKFKVPDIQIPSFDGNITEWSNFKTLFESIIHKNDDISPIQKLQYLKSLLQGEAAGLINSLSITEGHGKFNHLVLLTCGLIMLNVSMESLGMSYAITAAECELKLSNKHKGLINAAAFIGIISTSFLWGYLGDKLGRRAVMLPSIAASAVFSVASSFSTDVWMLLVLRILTGCLVSASSATVYAYLGEMHISSKRAAAIAWGSAFISFSFIILPGLAWVIIPGKWSFNFACVQVVPWRAFVWSWCAPGLVAAAMLLFLPESPRYLLSAKGPEAALPVLAKMFEWNHGSGAKYPVDKIVSSSVDTNKSGGFVGAVKNIALMFKPPLLRCVIISHISMFAVFMLSSGLYVWVPDILNNILRNTNDRSITVCQIILDKFQNASLTSTEDKCKAEVSVAVFPISMAMGAVFAITYLAIGVFINKIGRKTLYCSIMFVSGLATIGAGFVPHGGAATALVIIALCSGCAASILAAISVDVFPTCLRAMAMCVMYMVGRSGAAVGSNILGVTLDTNCYAAFTGFGVFIAGSTVLMFFWPKPEKVREEMERKGLTY